MRLFMVDLEGDFVAVHWMSTERLLSVVGRNLDIFFLNILAQ